MKVIFLLLNLLAALTLLTGILFRILHWPGANEWFLVSLLLVGSSYATRMIRKEPQVQLSHNKGQLNLGGRVLILVAILMLLLKLPYSLPVLMAGFLLLIIAYFLDDPEDPNETLEDRIDEMGKDAS